MLEKYEPAKLQEKWIAHWDKRKLYQFHLDSGKPYYVIDTPPPFPTGEFHMGGVLNWCYMDFAARFKRMSGFEVLFPQGWDCHGFPTEVKVEKKHGKGLPKDEFRKLCLQWTHDVVGTMKPQMKQMGFSIDWTQEYYTIDQDYYRKVQYSLLKMFEKGDVYRAEHPVLFCTSCRSAIAKAEVEEQSRETLMNDLRFEGRDGAPDVTVATTRPELLHATVAVLVHPDDARYTSVVGKKVKVPVHILSDSDVDPAFGSGAVMVSTFGDKQDVVWAYRHNLKVVKAMDYAGRMENAGALNGLKGKEAREKVLELAKAEGTLLGQKPLAQSVKIHDRCKHPVEFLGSAQWFIKLKGYENDIRSAAAAMRWTPEHARQLLLDWVEGLEWDWCISRQRTFGIPIPFWYCTDCGTVIAPEEKSLPVDPSHDSAPHACKCGGKVVGETSICDGWVDSSITPLIISGWPDDADRFQKLYPVTVRPQGTDIIRTWAFYTTYRCLRLTGQAPFSDLLINGMVLGNDGKKMSKSLGNYVEAKDVMNKAGVDALRQWAALSGSTGKDNVFYWKDVQYAQSFLNKLWNASKFIQKSLDGFDGVPAAKKTSAKGAKSTKSKANADAADGLLYSVTDHWVKSRLHQTIRLATESLKHYQYYEALTAIQAFFWHDVCDQYLEDVKHRIYGDDAQSKAAAQATLREVLDASVRLLAPFSPFVTDEIYSDVLGHSGSIHRAEWPAFEEDLVQDEYEQIGNHLHDALSQIRKFKAQSAIALNADLTLVKIRAAESVCKKMADVQDDLAAVAHAKAVEFEVVENAENQTGLQVECTV
ncbi:valine--tRNA ligase [Candidatus Micrarchaeota archaeon]|nr:valine--tRNA ligase [Candidatus Micrarchaeota archaeon]